MKIEIKPLGIFEKTLDILFLPIMYAIAWISGGFGESPQMTHRWNNFRFSADGLDTSIMCRVKGISEKVQKQGNFFQNALFHIPFLGGSKNYVVVSPLNPSQGWHAGWHNEYVTGVSRILVTKPVRLLIGPNPINFMGFDSAGRQILVRVVWYGKIGDAGPFKKLQLL